MSGRRRKSFGSTGGRGLSEAYKLGVYNGLRFIGTHLVSATITALTFMFVYKYVVSKEANQTPTMSGK